MNLQNLIDEGVSNCDTRIAELTAELKKMNQTRRELVKLRESSYATDDGVLAHLVALQASKTTHTPEAASSKRSMYVEALEDVDPTFSTHELMKAVQRRFGEDATNRTKSTQAVSSMKKKGIVKKLGRGIWEKVPVVSLVETDNPPAEISTDNGTPAESNGDNLTSLEDHKKGRKGIDWAKANKRFRGRKLTAEDLASEVGVAVQVARKKLSNLVQAGRVTSRGEGTYYLPVSSTL